MSLYIPNAPPDIPAAPSWSPPNSPRLSPILEKPETPETDFEFPPLNIAELIPRETLPDLAAEEALYRVWWRTLPNKPLARRCDGHLAHWQRERRLSEAALTGLRARVRDLLEGNGK